MVGTNHSGTLRNPGKTHRYGRWVVVRNAKTTGFPGGNALVKKEGCGTNSRKMRILTRKGDPLWFYPPEKVAFSADPERTDAKKLSNNTQKC
jgi:hypothetical protein